MIELPQQLVAGPSTVKLVNVKSDPSSPIGSPSRSPVHHPSNGVPVRRYGTSRADRQGTMLLLRNGPLGPSRSPDVPLRAMHRHDR